MMIKRTEYPYAAFRKYATYHFILRAPGMITLDDQLGHQKTLGVNGRRHEFYKFRNWVAVSLYQNQTCELTLRYNITWTRTFPGAAQSEGPAGQLPPGFLKVNFQAGAVDVESYIDGGPEWTEENVRALEIAPNQKITALSGSAQVFRPVADSSQRQDGRASPDAAPESAQGLFRIVRPNGGREEGGGFHIVTPRPAQAETSAPRPASDTPTFRPAQAETSSPRPASDTPTFRPAQAETSSPRPASDTPTFRPAQAETSSPRPASDTAQGELERTRAALNQAREELQRTQNERNQAREELQRTREEFAQERQRNESLRDALSGSLDGLAERLQPDMESLNASLREKARTLETRTAALETLSREVEALDSDLKAIETRTEELKVLKEMRSMDCQRAREELDALRTQCRDDDDSLTLLLQDDSILPRNKTLKDTLKRIGEELDAAERRIGRVIRWRESVNDVIQRTILDGNGLLDADAELKG